MNLKWSAELARGVMDAATYSSHGAAESKDADDERPPRPTSSRLVRRAVAFQVDAATSFLGAAPARAVSFAAASAPPRVELNRRAGTSGPDFRNLQLGHIDVDSADF